MCVEAAPPGCWPKTESLFPVVLRLSCRTLLQGVQPQTPGLGFLYFEDRMTIRTQVFGFLWKHTLIYFGVFVAFLRAVLQLQSLGFSLQGFSCFGSWALECLGFSGFRR